MSQITVNYAALEQGESTIKAIASAIEGKLSDLKGRLAKIEWDGSDRDAYNQYQLSWDNAVADMNQVLAKIGAAVATARENYQSTEQSNAQAWS
jgi:WXG100 family type VII secretion target